MRPEPKAAKSAPHPRVLGVFDDYSGCTMYRVLMPYAYLERAGMRAHWVPKADFPRVDLDAYDLIVLPRMGIDGAEKAKAAMAILRTSGRILVYETDDDLLNIPAHNPASAGVSEARKAGMREIIRGCHAVTCSNERLADTLRPHNPHVYVVPNHVDPALFRGKERSVEGLTIGVSGSASHAKDWEILAPVWARIAALHPGVRFVAQGYCPAYLREAVGERLTALPWAPLSRYAQQMGNLDISCCPLEDSPFNWCKTPIKAWESSLAGAAVVASPVLYSREIRHGEDGFLARTEEEWVRALDALVRKPKLRRQFVRAQQGHVRRDHAIERHIGAWARAFDQIYERFRGELRPPDVPAAERLAAEYATVLAA